MEIGFIGLGQMGFHMARRLVEAGHRVVVFDARREAVDRLTGIGAHPATSGRDIADQVETVMASLPTPDIVLSIATGAGGASVGVGSALGAQAPRIIANMTRQLITISHRRFFIISLLFYCRLDWGWKLNRARDRAVSTCSAFFPLVFSK